VKGRVSFGILGYTEKRVNLECLTISKVAKRAIKIRCYSGEKKLPILSGPDLYPGSSFARGRALLC
jgi:hypothetical protein